MAYQPLGQLAVDYGAIVIYGLCHRISIFLLKQARFKQRQFNLQWISFHVFFFFSHLFSTLWYTISNKSQSFVFLSPSFLCCSSDAAASGWSLRTGGGRRKMRASVSTWTLAEGLCELWFRQTNDLQTGVCRGGNLVIFVILCSLCGLNKPLGVGSQRHGSHSRSSFVSLWHLHFSEGALKDNINLQTKEPIPHSALAIGSHYLQGIYVLVPPDLHQEYFRQQT